jgi:hypothetical protein
VGFNNFSNPIATTNNEDFKITNGAISIFVFSILKANLGETADLKFINQAT